MNTSFRSVILGLLLTAAVLLPMSGARAQEDSGRDYIFGTRLVIISPNNLSGPNYAWWGDKLPMPYTHAVGWIVQIVNEARAERGNNEVVNYREYPVSINGEIQKGDSWEYYIDFMKMSPEDVQVVLDQFPMEGAMADLRTEIRPVSMGNYYGNSQEGGSVSLALPGGDMQFSPQVSYDENWNRVSQRLTDYFGREVKFDMSMNRYKAANGYNSFDVSVTIYMDDSWEMGAGYPTEYD
ncbi:MAG: hypothetical protein R3F46_07390 [bacterium]